jgi:aspartyl-tRNA(Asn)/glutamyl-tRNA(Gln) amidotransferase subunit A
MANALCWTTIAEVAPLLRSKKVSPVELTRGLLDRIDQLNPKLNAFITVLHDEAVQTAMLAEREIGAGHYREPLHGVPFAVKDVIAAKGQRTAAGQKS